MLIEFRLPKGGPRLNSLQHSKKHLVFRQYVRVQPKSCTVNLVTRGHGLY